MKRKFFTATVAAMMMVSSAVPAMAMVGAKKPENPEMMTITAVDSKVEKRITMEPVYQLPEPVLYKQTKGDLERVPQMEPGNKRWYTVDPSVLMRTTGMAGQYQIQEGDTIWKIVTKALQTKDANQIHQGVAKVIQMNQLANPDLIYPGQMLNMPVK